MDKNTLLSYQPDYYANSEVIELINNAIATEIENMRLHLINTLDQFFVSTADTSLDRWERDSNLSITNNYDTSYRQSKILSRIRGQGTVNAALIKNVAESFQNGTVDVIEDAANHSFTIKFVGSKGVPPNLDDLKEAIEEIKPAHLVVNYLVTYITWNEYETDNKTLSQWESMNLTWDNLEKYSQ